VFRHGDVVRHDLVRRIVAAYEGANHHGQNGSAR
jgi:phosphate starvation-inducible protein PhoH